MEPFPKRQRLNAPLGRDFSQRLEEQHAYYEETPETEFIEDEEEYDEEEVEETPAFDPDAELQQRRARLDYKLKSTFEAIFEKYGKDFDGVGDEIDLETGEIVVNNGHLLEMHDERDTGDIGRAREGLRGFTGEPDDLTSDIPSSSIETDILDDDDDELMSDEEMLEDDLILRGFAQANRFVQPPPELGHSRTGTVLNQHRQDSSSHLVPQSSVLPAASKIMAQFGPQIGPQIVEYISQQQVPDDNHIEPAWRAPELPSASSIRCPKINPAFFEPEPERSPSPKASTSLWAQPRQRKGRRLDGRDSEIAVSKEHQASQRLDPFRHLPTSDLGQLPQFSPPKLKGKRENFTTEDDRILLDWVQKAQKRGQALWSNYVWQELEAQHPRHPWGSWKARYRNKYTYLWSEQSDQLGESELSTSEESMGEMGYKPKPVTKQGGETIPRDPQYAAEYQRPARTRKPAQKDSRIISWSEAVDTIESLDSDLHAGILEDIRTTNGRNWKFENAISTSGQDRRFTQPRPRSSQKVEELQDENQLPSLPRRRPIDPIDEQEHHSSPNFPGGRYIDLTDDAEHRIPGSMAVEVTPEQDEFLIPSAPCQHFECKLYSTVMYRLQRREDEDLSEMSLHLFRVHHTTPYPCGEVNCKRRGEEGYFMQADLVKHVRTAHPTFSALHRLRGRVDSELLDRIDLARLSANPASIQPSNRPVSQQRDSDFMSPRKESGMRVAQSARPPSSSFDPDRTLTPRDITSIPGASTFTPMTSVSSLKENHSSGSSKALRELSHAKERPNGKANTGFDANWPGFSPEEQVVNGCSAGPSRRPSPGASSSSKGLFQGSGSRHNALPTPKASLGRSLGPTVDFEDPKRASTVTPNLKETNHQTESTKQSGASSVQKPITGPTSSPCSIPNSHSSSQKFSQSFLESKGTSQVEVVSSSQVSPSKTSTSKPAQVQESFLRNTVDPAYEFSDEELGIEPTTKEAPPQSSISTPSSSNPALPKQHTLPPIPDKVIQATANPPIAPLASKTSSITTKSSTMLSDDARSRNPKISQLQAKLSTVTPTANRKPPRAIPSRVFDADDLDELSLGLDDFVLMSSQSRTNPRPSTVVRVKQEDATEGPRTAPVASTKKRKLSMFQADNDEDELGIISSSRLAPSSVSNPRIKTEADENNPPLYNTTVSKRNDPRPDPSTTPRNKGKKKANRISTPFLDLTPNRRTIFNPSDTREIVDSEAPSSSPTHIKTSSENEEDGVRDQKQVAGTDSLLIGLLTPVRKQRLTGDPLQGEKVTIVIKTPGGTLRRCGEDDFSCGRSFCFRCGSKTGT